MPRRTRCIEPGVAHHVTQRGVDRRETFSTDRDRTTYLKLLSSNLKDSQTRILAWCLMGNHIHLVAIPSREDSVAVLFRRTHGRYAQYYNACHERSGHLWQNRCYSCALGWSHLWSAIAYVERNPVRAGLVGSALDYRWSSARAHVGRPDESGVLDLVWWREQAFTDWEETLCSGESGLIGELRHCTYSGKPFGDEGFVDQISRKFGRHWVRGGPLQVRRAGAGAATGPPAALPLFDDPAC